jgi:cold shock CspA family protein
MKVNELKDIYRHKNVSGIYYLLNLIYLKHNALKHCLGKKEIIMTSQTGIIRSFNSAENNGLITCDLGGDICFDASSVNGGLPVSGSLVEFIMDDSANKLQAIKIRLI